MIKKLIPVVEISKNYAVYMQEMFIYTIHVGMLVSLGRRRQLQDNYAYGGEECNCVSQLCGAQKVGNLLGRGGVG